MSDEKAIAARLTAIQEKLDHRRGPDVTGDSPDYYAHDDDIDFLLAHVETLEREKAQAEQQRDATHAALKARQAQLLKEHGGNCGDHEGLTYQYDMEVAAALHEIGLALAASAPQKEPR